MRAISKYNRVKRSILVGVLAVTLHSCFVAKNYERPEFESTQNLFRTDMLPTDSISMAAVPWESLFTDAYLKQYITEGLKNNLDIRMAVQQMISAEAYLKQGKAGYFPSLNTRATMTHQELSRNSQFGSFFNGAIQQFETSANLSWEADIWGKIRSNKRAFGANYLSTVAAHQAVKTRLIASIASTYYRLLALDAQLKVTQTSVSTQENSLKTIKALKKAGQVTQVAVDRNLAQYNNAKALQVDLEAAIFKTENTLSILMGQPARSIKRTSLSVQQLDTEITLGVPAQLLANRPDVKAAELNLIQSFEMTNVARANFYPSLSLTASGGFQSLELDELFSANSLFANVVAGLTQPVFNRRQIKTQYEVAQAQQEQALLNFKKALLTAGNEVSNALYTYKAETEKYTYRSKEVVALRQAEQNSEALLENGYANYLDVLTARQSALSAELNVIDSKLQQLLSTVTLYEALGGGVQ